MVQYSVAVMDTASKKQSYIVFVDEAGFMLSPLVRRTYAPRGQTPVIKVSSPHERISAIGAMTLLIQDPIQFGFQFHLLQDNANFDGLSVTTFIDGVRRRLRSPMTLIWDQIRIHKARPVREYLAKHPDIAVEEFPPYAPELNPVDQVWSYVKYGRLPNYCPYSLFELRERVTAELTRVKRRPALLRSLFSHTGLALDD
jgi:transposase